MIVSNEAASPNKPSKPVELPKKPSSPSPIPPLFSSAEISPFQSPPKKSPARKKKPVKEPESMSNTFSTPQQPQFTATIPPKNEYRYSCDKLVKSPYVETHIEISSESERFYQQYSRGSRMSSNK